MEVHAHKQMDILEKEVKFVRKPEVVSTIYFSYVIDMKFLATPLPLESQNAPKETMNSLAEAG